MPYFLFKVKYYIYNYNLYIQSEQLLSITKLHKHLSHSYPLYYDMYTNIINKTNTHSTNLTALTFNKVHNMKEKSVLQLLILLF